MSGGFDRIMVASHAEVADPELRAAAQIVGADNAILECFHVAAPEHARRETLDRILERVRERNSGLLVMGGRSHVLASRAAMMASCSLLMVPDDAELRIGRVLVSIDFSEHAGEALRVAADLARRRGGEVICVFVESEEAPWHSLRDERVEHEQKLKAVREFAKKILGDAEDVRCLAEPLERSAAVLLNELSLPHAIEGADIASTIEMVEAREEAKLLVLGTRGRSRSAAILLGSVTER